MKTAEIAGVGKVAICNGIAAAQHLLQTEAWRQEFVAIEVMACVGGCLGGGGEPKSMDPKVLEKRMQAVYAMDKNALHRRSYQNPDIQALYANELQHPNSSQAHALLHTSYAARHSSRLLLMRFLDAVDRRDESAVAELFHPEALWSTASPFGEVCGSANIAALILRLPARQYGPHFARHRMESRGAVDDLTVITPDGERCRFHIETEVIEGGVQSRRVIKVLRREVL